MEEKLDKLFHLKERGTNVRTEVLAGLTAFVTAAYVLAVNPSVMSATGMDSGAVFTATALVCFLGTLVMALLTNYPFVLVPSMGLNAYFAYTVVLGMGYSWETALAAIFLEGVVFALISLTSLRDKIFNAIPLNLKYAISAGIGLFITIIGLKNSGLVISSSATLVSIFSFTGSMADGTFNTAGISVVLFLVGLVITGILMAKNVKGNILLGILITWILGIVCQLCGLYVPNPDAGFASLLPDFSNGLAVLSIAPTFMKMDFSHIADLGFLVVAFAFLLTSLFDTVGTLIGLGAKANLLDEDGNMPGVRGAMMGESVATMIAGVLGNSATCCSVEVAAGIAEGGRTGLMALTTGVLFLLSMFLSPIFLAIPSFATAPALVLVGSMMASSVLSIDFSDPSESIPAFLCFVGMPFCYSIVEGISLGIISYVGINLFCGKENRKKISPMMYVLAAIFILKYVLI
ncbi:NCS2 family permease [uncultured Parolsenella sp.]|uniref:NCS2 family permease n=1 Tax=uncultured Parolsenella sp. TaxID=2083008 RepID=UPI0025DEDC94|nr:NCS2 family permease [uncultured Parolsenella sp.]